MVGRFSKTQIMGHGFVLLTVCFAKFVDRESTPKYYFFDNGLSNLFLFRKDTSLLEIAVAAHLRRTHHEELFFLKSAKTGVDVDFFTSDDGVAI